MASRCFTVLSTTRCAIVNEAIRVRRRTESYGRHLPNGLRQRASSATVRVLGHSDQCDWSADDVSLDELDQAADAVEVGVGMVVVRVEQDRMQAGGARAAPMSIVTESPT